MAKRQTNVAIVTTAVFVEAFLAGIASTSLTTAMPTIVAKLSGMEIMNWVFSIYLLTMALLTPIYGKLADRIGRKKVFIFGVALFSFASVLCGLSQNMLSLIIFRGLQGIGAGAISPISMTIIGDIFPVEKRSKIIGLNNAAWGVASIVGPLCGGFIVDVINWHWIFLMNVPVGIVIILLIQWGLVEEKKTENTAVEMDIKGSIFLMLTLLTLLFGVQLLEKSGINAGVLGLFGLFILFLILFIRNEKTAADPVISLTLFKSRIFVIANVVTALVIGFVIALDVYMPMWMQTVLGTNASLGGLTLAPMSFTWVCGSFLSGRLLKQKSIRESFLMGLVPLLIGAGLLSVIPFATPYLFYVLIAAFCGFGFGIMITSATVAVQQSVPENMLGVGTSFNVLARTIGQTVMIAIFGVILNSQLKYKIAAVANPAITMEKMNQLTNAQSAKQFDAGILQPLREIYHESLHGIFLCIVFFLIAALLLSLRLSQKKKQKL